MHLKNFSMYSPIPDNYQLAPAYDLLNTLLVMPSDTEELALTLNARKKKIKLQDFRNAMINSGLDEKVIQNMLKKFHAAEKSWYDWIERSFLTQEMKMGYKTMIVERLDRLN